MKLSHLEQRTIANATPTMATKDKTPAAPTATPPSAPDNGGGKTKSVGRPKGTSTKDNDVFKAVDPQPKEKKIAPQAQNIANLVVAAGTKGLTRAELVKNMDGVVQTRQPQSRILSYYQKLLVDEGFVTVTAGSEPAKPAESAEAAK